MPTLNIGILAHVDAGKTSLTERLLYDTGTIDGLGSVDAGSTQTDTGDIERRRGITIRSAVASFAVGDLRVNLIDTPGHSDFVAEVERALGVLDGAVLVLSAVEGVQAHSRVLMKTLHRMRLPTLVFVNKIDRRGARHEGTLEEIRRRLSRRIVPMNTVLGAGTSGVRTRPEHLDHRAAEVLADGDDALLADLVDGALPSRSRLMASLTSQTAAGLAHPVYFGSALGGQGVAELLDGIGRLLPPARPAEGDGTRGTVFAISHDDAGKLAYVRLWSGELRPRERVHYHRREPDGTVAEHVEQITALDGVRPAAGDIARVRGLTGIRIGDQIGSARTLPGSPRFAPPSMETVVRARHEADSARLHAALVTLADQDPLISTRVVTGQGTSVLLYGEVQRQVIEARLAEDFGVEAVFEPGRTVHLERPAGTGEACEEIDRRGTHDFLATVGLRVSPGATGSGVVFRREVELGALPLALDRAIEETVHHTLDQGIHGWQVTDCVVTLTRSGFAPPLSTAADFRGLTPLVLMRALSLAGVRVYEPCHAFELEIPLEALSPVTARLAALGAGIRESAGDTEAWHVTGEIPARRVPDVQRDLPGLSQGEGVWWSRPYGDRPISGTIPTRERSDGNPLNRQEYLRHLSRNGR